MKSKFLLTLMALSAVACSKSADSGQGNLALTIVSDTAIADVVKSQVSDYGALPSADDFTLEIKDSKSASVWKGKVRDWNTETPLHIGNYTATVEYGSVSEEGFGKPAFTGNANFVIEPSDKTEVTVEAKTANALVKIECSDNFKNYFIDYSFLMKTGGLTEIPFVKDETRAAFIDAYKFEISGALTTQTGKTLSLESREFNDLAAATLYKIVFDVDNVGGLKVTVSFNDDVETINLEEELND